LRAPSTFAAAVSPGAPSGISTSGMSRGGGDEEGAAAQAEIFEAAVVASSASDALHFEFEDVLVMRNRRSFARVVSSISALATSIERVRAHHDGVRLCSKRGAR